MKTITIQKLILYLNQRVPISDFLGINSDVDLSPIYTKQDELLVYLNLEISLSIVSSISDSNPYYVRIFLKHLISHLESRNEEVHDELYELYCLPNIMSSKELDPTDIDVIQYSIGGFKKTSQLEYITIKETPRLLSGNNTTGQRTWEAALYLSNYLNENHIDLKNSTICELGAGTGLVSLSLLKSYHILNGPIKEIAITDGTELLIDKLSDSIHINNLQNVPKIRCQQLLWGTTNKYKKDGSVNVDFIVLPPNAEYVIAADVTYDSRIVDKLASTIHDFFSNGTRAAYVAATIRNEDSNLIWEQTLDTWFPNRWSVKDICEPLNVDSYCWFRVGTPVIRLYEIQAL